MSHLRQSCGYFPAYMWCIWYTHYVFVSISNSFHGKGILEGRHRKFRPGKTTILHSLHKIHIRPWSCWSYLQCNGAPAVIDCLFLFLLSFLILEILVLVSWSITGWNIVCRENLILMASMTRSIIPGDSRNSRVDLLQGISTLIYWP